MYLLIFLKKAAGLSYPQTGAVRVERTQNIVVVRVKTLLLKGSAIFVERKTKIYTKYELSQHFWSSLYLLHQFEYSSTLQSSNKCLL